MTIWTSYFYAIRFMKPWQIPISTAVFDPKWFHAFRSQKYVFKDKNGVINGLRSEKLHPGKTCEGLCSGRPCEFSYESCRFLKEYRKQLEALDLDSILISFKVLADRAISGKNYGHAPEIILLVHEAPNNQCSERRVLQDIFSCGEFDWRHTV